MKSRSWSTRPGPLRQCRRDSPRIPARSGARPPGRCARHVPGSRDRCRVRGQPPARGDSSPQLPQFAVEQRFADLDETVGCQPDLRGTAQGRHEQGPFVVASRAQQVTRSHHIAQCIRDHQTQPILVRHWQMLDGHTPFEVNTTRPMRTLSEAVSSQLPSRRMNRCRLGRPVTSSISSSRARRRCSRRMVEELKTAATPASGAPARTGYPPRADRRQPARPPGAARCSERRGTGFEHETHVGARVTTAQPQPQKPANPVRVARPGFGTQEFGAKSASPAAADSDALERRPRAAISTANSADSSLGSTTLAKARIAASSAMSIPNRSARPPAPRNRSGRLLPESPP